MDLPSFTDSMSYEEPSPPETPKNHSVNSNSHELGHLDSDHISKNGPEQTLGHPEHNNESHATSQNIEQTQNQQAQNPQTAKILDLASSNTSSERTLSALPAAVFTKAAKRPLIPLVPAPVHNTTKKTTTGLRRKTFSKPDTSSSSSADKHNGPIPPSPILSGEALWDICKRLGARARTSESACIQRLQPPEASPKTT